MPSNQNLFVQFHELGILIRFVSSSSFLRTVMRQEIEGMSGHNIDLRSFYMT